MVSGLLLLASLLLPGTAAAELADPTKPPASILAEEERARRLAAGGDAAKNLPPLPRTDGVRVIINGADRKLAVVDGEVVKTKNPSGLSVHPNVKKTPATSAKQQPSSTKDQTPAKRPVKVIQR
jgi:hypothetical protein